MSEAVFGYCKTDSDPKPCLGSKKKPRKAHNQEFHIQDHKKKHGWCQPQIRQDCSGWGKKKKRKKKEKKSTFQVATLLWKTPLPPPLLLPQTQTGTGFPVRSGSQKMKCWKCISGKFAIKSATEWIIPS